MTRQMPYEPMPASVLLGIFVFVPSVGYESDDQWHEGDGQPSEAVFSGYRPAVELHRRVTGDENPNAVKQVKHHQCE